MLFRPRRGRRGPDRFLGAKMTLLAAGGAMALAGFVLGLDWLVTGAILPLMIGVGLSFRRGSGEEAAEDEGADPDSLT